MRKYWCDGCGKPIVYPLREEISDDIIGQIKDKRTQVHFFSNGPHYKDFCNDCSQVIQETKAEAYLNLRESNKLDEPDN